MLQVAPEIISWRAPYLLRGGRPPSRATGGKLFATPIEGSRGRCGRVGVLGRLVGVGWQTGCGVVTGGGGEQKKSNSISVAFGRPIILLFIAQSNAPNLGFK